MPFDLPLPRRFIRARWKVKILDNELLEHPHATIVRGEALRWRINLRTGEFMDRKPSPRGVNKQVLASVMANLEVLRAEWNLLHPNNPV